ncbi:hypothetical protein CRG98_021591 [Punica granatum]|uniref:F-box associated beta-propeller type 3 domain-containing protein n=1 Tax=Punica granatum TaxID=22663 RepID=A0A2I0JP49_PUNGR|nr:hypothetical protein CRG98_021591 [Punica granatum]
MERENLVVGVIGRECVEVEKRSVVSRKMKSSSSSIEEGDGAPLLTRLPPDMIVGILLRLPMKSLGRFSKAEEGIQLCNPSTAECITFPKPYYADSFLGYDPVEKKHKILKFTFAEKEVEILTLREQEWRRMNPCLLDFESFEDDSLCIERFQYLIGRTEAGKAYLVEFNVRLESFRAVPLPEECEYYSYMCLTEFGGRVALFDYGEAIADGLHGEIRAWVLDDLHKQVWSCQARNPSPHLDDTLPIRLRWVGVTHAVRNRSCSFFHAFITFATGNLPTASSMTVHDMPRVLWIRDAIVVVTQLGRVANAVIEHRR